MPSPGPRAHVSFVGSGKLHIHFERRLDIHVALFSLAAADICSRFVDNLREPLLTGHALNMASARHDRALQKLTAHIDHY